MAGPSSQGWSKMAGKYNFGEPSDPNGRPWKMPAEMKAKVLEKDEELDREAKENLLERQRLDDLKEEVANKGHWIKNMQQEINTAKKWVDGKNLMLYIEQDKTRDLQKEYNKRNRWVIKEKKKFPSDFPEV